MIRQRFRNSGRAAIFCIACLLPALLAAQSEDDFDDRPRAFALPVELDVDRGGANGDAAIMRIQPLYTFPVGEKWKLVHLTDSGTRVGSGGMVGARVRVTRGTRVGVALGCAGATVGGMVAVTGRSTTG